MGAESRCKDRLSAERQAELVHQFLCKKWLQEGVTDSIHIVIPCEQYLLFPSLLVSKTVNSRISHLYEEEHSEFFRDYFVSRWGNTEVHHMSLGWSRAELGYTDSLTLSVYPTPFYIRALSEYYCYDEGTVKEFEVFPHYMYLLGELQYFERFTYADFKEKLDAAKNTP